ncbi:hypothetical protein RB600_007994 [Gaeumannomyces tritici]
MAPVNISAAVERSAVLGNRAAGHNGVIQSRRGVANTHPNIWVEVLTPRDQRHEVPIVMVHGDYHTGSVWDMDLDRTQDSRTWAECFLGAGYQVHLVDLPGVRLSGSTTEGPDRPIEPRMASTGFVEVNLTGMGHRGPFMYDSAWRHVGFPGGQDGGPYSKPGWRQDPAFDYYYGQMEEKWEFSGRPVQWTMDAAAAVVSVIERLPSKRAVLVAEGRGSEVAMMVADYRPELVASILAVGHSHAPFANTLAVCMAANKNRGVAFTGAAMTERRAARQGIFDVPMQFYPPLPHQRDYNPEDGQVFETIVHRNEDGDECLLQDPAKTVRTLPFLAQVPIAIMTAEASINSSFDWAIVKFLEQAGVKTEWLKLAEFGILGNGPLPWLEKGAAESGKLAVAWATKTTSADANEVAAATALLTPSPENVAVARERRREDRERADAKNGEEYFEWVHGWLDKTPADQWHHPTTPADKYAFEVGLAWPIPPDMKYVDGVRYRRSGDHGTRGDGGNDGDDGNGGAGGRKRKRQDGDVGQPGPSGGLAN